MPCFVTSLVLFQSHGKLISFFFVSDGTEKMGVNYKKIKRILRNARSLESTRRGTVMSCVSPKMGPIPLLKLRCHWRHSILDSTNKASILVVTVMQEIFIGYRVFPWFTSVEGNHPDLANVLVKQNINLNDLNMLSWCTGLIARWLWETGRGSRP